MQAKPFFGMEDPLGSKEWFHSQCLVLSTLNGLEKTSDGECEEEIANNVRLGDYDRMAAYVTKRIVTITTNTTAGPTFGVGVRIRVSVAVVIGAAVLLFNADIENRSVKHA